MFVSSPKGLEFITSAFTRQQGYINIQSSREISHNHAIKILNSFTPQGASPKISIRIGSINDLLGIGYYYMENHETARLSTLLFNNKNQYSNVDIPVNEIIISKIARGKYEYYNKTSIINSNFGSYFREDHLSSILYSLLAGDNIIIVHPKHEERLKFLSWLISFLPSIIYKYTRLTSNCSELNDNENIIGVKKLPDQYRSHKKLFLPLDTIFIDLPNKIVQGEGRKTCNLTDELSKNIQNDDFEFTQVRKLFRKINESPSDIYNMVNDGPSKSLINHIRGKLGHEKSPENNWLMSF